MRRAVLYLCYFDAEEPLVETQVIPYLGELAGRGVDVHLLSFDQKKRAPSERERVKSRLLGQGIRWSSLKYHRRPSLPATLFDIAVGSLEAIRLCRRHGIRLIHARSHVPAAMAMSAKRVLGCRILFDVRGLLANEYADAGHWREGDLKYRLTKAAERRLYREADGFVMLTHAIKSQLVADEAALRGRKDDIMVIPCCVDTDAYAAAASRRGQVRSERNWTDRLVLTYAGKLGTWYLHEEMARFFARAREAEPRLFFNVLTTSDGTQMRRTLEAAAVPPHAFAIGGVSSKDVPAILAASDAGISFRRKCYSQRAASPTKIGEYLAAGLPVVTNDGVGDYDDVFRDGRLGVLVRDFTESEYSEAAARLRSLMTIERPTDSCRQFAARELSLTAVGGPRYAELYDRLFSS